MLVWFLLLNKIISLLLRKFTSPFIARNCWISLKILDFVRSTTSFFVLFREIKRTRESFFFFPFFSLQRIVLFPFACCCSNNSSNNKRLWTTARFIEGGEVWMDNRWRCCSCKRPMFPLVSDKIDSICNCCGARVNAFCVNTSRPPTCDCDQWTTPSPPISPSFQVESSW